MGTVIHWNCIDSIALVIWLSRVHLPCHTLHWIMLNFLCKVIFLFRIFFLSLYFFHTISRLIAIFSNTLAKRIKKVCGWFFGGGLKKKNIIVYAFCHPKVNEKIKTKTLTLETQNNLDTEKIVWLSNSVAKIVPWKILTQKEAIYCVYIEHCWRHCLCLHLLYTTIGYKLFYR